MKTTAILTFKDSKNAYLRFFEAVIGAAFLALVTLVADIKEAGYGAIPIVLIPILLIIDDLVRFFVLKDGIVVDLQNGTISIENIGNCTVKCI